MFAARNYTKGMQVLLAACDPELLDSRYKEGKLRLEVLSGFYDGMRIEETDLQRFLQQCTVANLVGSRTVAVAIAMGLVDDAHVRTVEGVPHAQMVIL